MLFLSLLMTTAIAGVLDQPWRTVETEHFRLHYPIEAEAWALDSAAQLEVIRDRVSEEVGYEPENVVDIVVMDPMTRSNGFALPWINGPRMGIYATPPPADSVLGNYRSWEEDLILHEDVHLVHMMIPSRNPWVHMFVDNTIGAGPIIFKGTRWITEGYATVVEGKLTGYGRPNSDGRAIFLRQMAREGRMPTYGELDGTDKWRGGSYAYLVGSAFLEWLEANHGDDSLRDLWTALSAHKQRDLDEAFKAVFGQGPERLYARFVAELTHDALVIEEARPVQEDTLWQNLWGSTGAPAVSPDGEHLAIVVRVKDEPSKLVVVPTTENEEARETWQEGVDEALEKDPEDITPVEPEVFGWEVEHERVRPDRGASGPRWTPDGELLFTSWLQASDGRLVPDLILWDPEGRERRVTREASVHTADPHPDGERAIAIRQKWSESQLVWVDLDSGDWTAITEPDVNAVLGHPRISPDGNTLAYLRNVEGWELVLRTLESGVERVVSVPEGAFVAEPAWAPDGSGLYASLGVGGFVEAWFLPLDGQPRQVTAGRGGASAPEPTPDGESLYFLAIDAGGLDLHKVSLDEPVPETQPFVVSPPVLRPPAPAYIQPPPQAAVTPMPYRAGGLSVSPIYGANVDRDAGWMELGLRVGDVAGRTTGHLFGATDLLGSWGVYGAVASRALPVTITAHGFILDESFADLSGILHRERMGAELDVDKTFTYAIGETTVLGGGWLDRPTSSGDTEPADTAVFGRLETDNVWWFSQAWAGFDLALGQQYGVNDSIKSPWNLSHGALTLKGGWWPVGVEAHAEWTGSLNNADPGALIIGGLSRSLYAPGWSSRRHVFVPALPTNLFKSNDHRAASLALNVIDGVSIIARQDTADVFSPTPGIYTGSEDDTDTDRQDIYHLAVEANADLDAQPIGKISNLEARLGVACIMNEIDALWTDRACRSLDDYNAWLGLTWRP